MSQAKFDNIHPLVEFFVRAQGDQEEFIKKYGFIPDTYSKEFVEFVDSEKKHIKDKINLTNLVHYPNAINEVETYFDVLKNYDWYLNDFGTGIDFWVNCTNFEDIVFKPKPFLALSQKIIDYPIYAELLNFIRGSGINYTLIPNNPFIANINDAKLTFFYRVFNHYTKEKIVPKKIQTLLLYINDYSIYLQAFQQNGGLESGIEIFKTLNDYFESDEFKIMKNEVFSDLFIKKYRLHGKFKYFVLCSSVITNSNNSYADKKDLKELYEFFPKILKDEEDEMFLKLI